MATLIYLFGIILLVPAVIAFAIPSRYFGFLVASAAMLLAVGWVWPTGPDHSSSPFSGTGDAIYLLLCMVIAGILAARGMVIAIRRQPSGQPAEPLAWAAVGALGAPCFMAIVSLPGAEGRPASIAYLPALAILGSALAVLIACWWLANRRLRAFAFGLAASASITAVLTGNWIVSRIDAVVDAAETFAGDKPYCIQVAARRQDFVQAKARLDFSPLTMRTTCPQGWCWQYHAILVVEEAGGAHRLINWSHRSIGFRDEVSKRLKPPVAAICQPAPHFARELPWL